MDNKSKALSLFWQTDLSVLNWRYIKLYTLHTSFTSKVEKDESQIIIHI